MDMQIAKHSDNSHPIRVRRYRMVVIAGTAAFCVFLCIAGFFWADYNTTRVGNGQASLRTDFYIDGGQVVFELSGSRTAITLTPAVSELLTQVPKIFTPGGKVTLMLVQGGEKAVQLVCNQVMYENEEKQQTFW